MKNNEHISREAFEKLLREFSEGKNIPNLDAFEQDALEGWKNSGIPFSKLKQLDSKIGAKKATFLPYIIGIGVFLIGMVVFWIGSKSNSMEVNQTPLVVKLENTDVRIPQEIEELNAIPQKDQISVNEIKKTQSEIKLTTPLEKQEEITDIPFPQKALEPLPPVIEQKPQVVSKQKLAKEVIFHELKAIDYSNYRSKPTVQIEQVILTGVPANQEHAQTVVADESEIKLVQVPYMDYLEKSLNYTNRGKWKMALSRFNEIIQNYPDDVNARFYAGWCLYNLGQYADACISFSTCLQLEFANFNDEAEWYLAESRLANGEKQVAKELFTKIRNQKGFYAKQAEKVLKTWK